jgi:hypothetical protein
MTQIFHPFSILDPALAEKQIEGALAHGGAVRRDQLVLRVPLDIGKQGRIDLHSS